MTVKSISYSPKNFPQKKLWMAAIKLPMYSVAIIPIWVGSAIAYSQTKIFNTQIFLTFAIAAILILAWENLSNDVFDSETEIDKNKHHSLVNLTRNKQLIFWLGNSCLLTGLLGIFAIAWWQQDLTVIGLILVCCILGYIYQGPPFRFGYQGLGEILCFFAFGPVAVEAAYYSQAQSFSGAALIASISVGIATSLVLYCSHFHQVEDDLAAGKKSPIVRLGTQRGSHLLNCLTASIYVIGIIYVLIGDFPMWTLLSWVSLPFAIKLCLHVHRHHHHPENVSNSKFIAIGVHFWYCSLFGLGFML